MALPLLQKALDAYDSFCERFQCEVAEGSLIQECIKLDHEDTFDSKSIHIVCRDRKKGKIVGTARLTKADFVQGSEDSWKEFHLDLFPKELLPRISLITRMVILNEYQNTAASLSLTLKIYEHNLLRIKTVLSVILCEPNLYPYYRQFGFRPLDRVFASSTSGYRLPLLLIPHDFENLKRIASPFYKIAEKYGLPREEAGLEWQKQDSKRRGAIMPGYVSIPPVTQKDFHALFLQGLSEASKKLLLKNAMIIQCWRGDIIIKKGSKEKNLCYVRKGAVEVRDDRDHVLMIFGEGDIFGEVAMIINTPRTANVVAAMPNTEITLLSPSAISRLRNKDDQIQIWKNLAAFLARRLIAKP